MSSLNISAPEFESKVFIEKPLLVSISHSEHDVVSYEKNVEHGIDEFSGRLLGMEHEKRRESRSPTFTDIPLELVQHILSKLHPLELYCCYGVSTGIRRIVKKRLVLLDKLGVYLSDKLCAVFSDGLYCKYTKEANGCGYEYGTYKNDENGHPDILSGCKEKIGFLENVKYDKAGLNVFLSVLTTPEIHLEYLSIDFTNGYNSNKFSATVKNTLISLKVPLHVTSVLLENMNRKQVMRIVPYLKPKILKSLYMTKDTIGEEDKETMKELTRTEQWKQAEIIKAFFPTMIAIKKYLHLREFLIYRNKMTARELVNIRNSIFKHKHIEHVEVKISDREFDIGIARRALGPCTADPTDPEAGFYHGADAEIDLWMHKVEEDGSTTLDIYVHERMMELI